MGAPIPWVIPLAEAASTSEQWIGGKAAKLSKLIDAGYKVPDGFCISTEAYRRFLEHGKLKKVIEMEIRRKSMSNMRWEEIWDAALRIRTAFLRSGIPEDVSRMILKSYRELAEISPGSGPRVSLAVRSSAIGEDSETKSYAGLHESVVGVMGDEALLDAVRIVWASLWSDAALLYRREIELDAGESAMAVVVQTLVTTDRSGVGFGRDPRNPGEDKQIIEAVPGLCQDLVDGAVDPDRWFVRRSDGEIIEYRRGERGDTNAAPILDNGDVSLVHQTLRDIEKQFGWPPDIEWTGRRNDFTVLQARPVTASHPQDKDDQREWYLSLRPGKSKLKALCARVTEELIPALEAEGLRLAKDPIEDFDDEALADAIDSRFETHARWKKIYWDEFIPFAHGVRQLGQYYNDVVKPSDSYEFIGILRNQPMIAAERNAALNKLAMILTKHPALFEKLERAAESAESLTPETWASFRKTLSGLEGGLEFGDEFDRFCNQFMGVVYGGEALDTRPDIVLHTVVELTQTEAATGTGVPHNAGSAGELEKRLLDAVGPSRHEEAKSVIEIARLSWKLRDDDNVLLGRVEKQLLRAAGTAAKRLKKSGRLAHGATITLESSPALSAALRDDSGGTIVLEEPGKTAAQSRTAKKGEKPRQIVGQPAAPGLATAKARRVLGPGDLKAFHAGEILVCDAIQPTMSHVVPLAAAIVERRGGMLIHGAIIARELGIPCVNGVSDNILAITNGEIVTVDGHLGIVTIGPPEFDLETGIIEGS